MHHSLAAYLKKTQTFLGRWLLMAKELLTAVNLRPA